MALQSKRLAIAVCALLIASCTADPLANGARLDPDQHAEVHGLPSEPDPLHRHLPVPLATGDGTTLMSGMLGDGATFDEALPSWNVPPDAEFAVEIRVTLDRDADWSPWLRIGDWNVTTRPDAVTTAFDGGKVAVDVLELTEPYTLAQLRIRSLNGIALRHADVRASIVLTDTQSLDARVATARTEPWPHSVKLDVPARSQRSVGDDIGGRVCSPTSVAMVTEFHGQAVPTRTMAERLLDPHFDIYGNWNRAVQGAFAFGVPGELVRVSSWSRVRDYLSEGRPVIASIRAKEGQLAGAPYEKTSGHLLVVTGLASGGAVHVNDPAAPPLTSVRRVYRRADMETVWFARGGVAYVLDAPGAKATAGRPKATSAQ